MTSPPPSIPEVDSESQHSLRGALHSEIAASSGSHSISSPLSTDRTYREVSSLQRTLAAEAEKQVQSLESEQRLEDQQQDSEENSSEERIERKTLSNQARDRHHEVVDEPPTQRPRLENPASAIRWSKTDESGHWSPITDPEQRRCGLRQTLRYCGNSRLMITSGKTRVSQSVSFMRNGAISSGTHVTILLRM